MAVKAVTILIAYCQGGEGKMYRDIAVSPPPGVLWLFGFVSFLRRKTCRLWCRSEQIKPAAQQQHVGMIWQQVRNGGGGAIASAFTAVTDRALPPRGRELSRGMQGLDLF